MCYFRYLEFILCPNLLDKKDVFDLIVLHYLHVHIMFTINIHILYPIMSVSAWSKDICYCYCYLLLDQLNILMVTL